MLAGVSFFKDTIRILELAFFSAFVNNSMYLLFLFDDGSKNKLIAGYLFIAVNLYFHIRKGAA